MYNNHTDVTTHSVVQRLKQCSKGMTDIRILSIAAKSQMAIFIFLFCFTCIHELLDNPSYMVTCIINLIKMVKLWWCVCFFLWVIVTQCHCFDYQRSYKYKCNFFRYFLFNCWGLSYRPYNFRITILSFSTGVRQGILYQQSDKSWSMFFSQYVIQLIIGTILSMLHSTSTRKTYCG